MLLRDEGCRTEIETFHGTGIQNYRKVFIRMRTLHNPHPGTKEKTEPVQKNTEVGITGNFQKYT